MRENFDLMLFELSKLDALPICIVLTETWIYSNEISNYSIDGYNCYDNCNDSYRSGGIAVYIKSGVEVTRFNKLTLVSADGIKINFEINKCKFCLVAFYRLSSLPASVYVNELKDYLPSVKDENLLYAGDINIDILKINAITDEYNFTLASFGLKSLVNEPTRLFESSVSCIDHLFVRFGKMTENICPTHSVQHRNVTDHSLITLHITMPLVSPEVANGPINYSQIDHNTLSELLAKETWANIYACTEANEAFGCFFNIFENLVSAATKPVVIKGGNKAKSLKPWLNNTILGRIKKKNALYNKVINQPYNAKLSQYYKRYRNNLKKEIASAKTNYYQEIFNQARENNSGKWNIVNRLLGVNNTGKEIKLLKTEGGQVLTDKSEIADKLNDHFINVMSEARKDSTILNENNRHRYNSLFPESKSNSNSMYFLPTSAAEIENIVKSLKLKKAPGIDGVKIQTIKSIIEHIAEVLAFIYNLSMTTGVYPQQLKNAVIVPIYKSGCKDCPNNYRPIALLSVFAKVLEKLIRIRLSNYLNKINFLSKNQFGFRKGFKTEDAMINILDPVYEGINNDKKVVSLFLDIRKAFDTVNHEILLIKLRNAGIRGVCNDWFASFLSSRTQQVRISDVLSTTKPVECGVPQGSGLSTELFLIFINSLCEGSLNGKLTSFADDTALSYSADTKDLLIDQVNDDLQSLSLWFYANALRINVDKTKLVSYKLRPNCDQPLNFKMHNMGCSKISCGCGQIEEVNSVKYLGITIDSRLSWHQQIAVLKKEILFICRKLYFIRSLCPSHVIDMLYYALVQSRLLYGIAIWGGAYFSEIKPLITGQKFIIRTMSGKSRMHPSLPLFRDKKILPLRYLYFYKVLEIFFIKSGQYPINDSQGNYNLRSINVIRPPRPKKEIFRRFYSYVAPRIYGTLPMNIKRAKGVNKFKIELKKWLLGKDDVERLFTNFV